MKKYFLNDGTSQQGPFDLEELKAKNLKPETPIWYEGLPAWTTAGQVAELKEFFVIAPAPVVVDVPPAVVEPAPVAPVAAATTATSIKTHTTTGKKSTAWISWALGLLVLGGIGFLIYQDMEKNKTASSSVQTAAITDTTAVTTEVPVTTTPSGDTTTATIDTASITTTATTDPVPTDPTAPGVTTTTTTTKPTTTTAQQTQAQKAAAKKAEEDKKKKQTAAEAAKKAEEDKKKLQAAQAAAAAKELEMRNNWPKYVTFGKLAYDTKGEGISAFDVPVYNNTDAVLDKVTVRIDYMKKEKKAVKSETIEIYRIPPHAGLNGKAPESKKGEKVNVYITAISSRGLHFCYPQNNGNPSDPYFCK